MSQWNPSSGSEWAPKDPNEDQTDPIPEVAGEPAEGAGEAAEVAGEPAEGTGESAEGDETLVGWGGEWADQGGQRPGQSGEERGWGGEERGWGGERSGWADTQPGWYREPPHPGPAPLEDTHELPRPVDPADQPPIWAGRPQAPASHGDWEYQQPPKAYLHQQPEPPGPQRRRRGVIAAFAVILVLVAGGAALALEVRSHGGGNTAGAHPRAGGGQRSSPGASPQLTPGRTAATRPSAGPRGHASVTVAPAAAANPAAPRVTRFLTRYFKAINAHNYHAYRRLLDGQMRQVETAQRFSAGFRSTRDSGARLNELYQTPDGRLSAVVAFTSHQSPADSPDQSACTHWTITLYLEQAGGSYVIGPPPIGYQASHAGC